MAVSPGRVVRQVAVWLPAALLVPAAMVAAVTVSRPTVEAQELRDLVPLEIGTTWVYEVSDHGQPSGTRTRQVTAQAAVDVEIFDAVTVSSSYTDYPGVGATSELLYLGLEDEQVLQLGLYSHHEHIDVDPPAPAYRLPLTEGESWSYRGTVGAAKLRYEVTLQSIEDVEVSGRTFTDCVHYVNLMEWRFAGADGFGPEQHYEEWVCPGFGPVRTIDSSEAEGREITEELVEFHGASGNWFARSPEPAAPTTAEPAGGTVGFGPQHSNYVDGEISPDLAWGDARGHRFDVPPATDGEVLVLAERDGAVSARRLDTGEMRWRVRLAGPIVAAPTIAGDLVLVADSDKRLWALSMADGSAAWVRTFDDVVSAAATAAADTVVVGTDDRRLTAIDLTDSSTRWSHDLPGRLGAAPAIDGDRVVVAGVDGEVAAYDLATGDETWSRGLEGGHLAGPAVSDGRVHVADDTGVLYALAGDSGAVEWEERTVYYPSEELAVGNGALLSVGDAVRLEAYDLEDGAERWSVELDGADVAPVIVGDRVVTVDDGVTVTVRDLADGTVLDSWELPLPTADATAYSVADPALAGGALLLHANITARGHNDALYAYPVDAEGERPGLSFATDTRPAPGYWGAAAVLVDDVLFTPGSDFALYRSPARGDATAMLEGDAMLPGVVAAGDVVLTQQDTDVLALPVGGGDPVWRYESTPGYPGMVPAVSGDTVFVPQYGTGLAAVSLRDGSERWATPVDLAFGTSSPLPLPDGDVVYGGGPLARFDGTTGRQEWSILDGVLFGNAAYDDGLVFADVVRNLSPNSLTAVDARTGETVWSHEHDNAGLVVGPEAGEGVVVHPDSQGLVTVYDARTGEELWRLQLATTIAGHPVIAEGVVYLTETGRTRDIFTRDYRVTAHELRTGRFLGAFQPPGTAGGLVPLVDGDENGILVPTVASEPAVMIVRAR